MELKKIIHEVFFNMFNKEDKCYKCNDKFETKGPSFININESVYDNNISEGLKFHIEKNKPLYENIYRPGSKKYFSLWKEVRTLYENGLININNTDKEILNETNIGEFDIFEEQLVPLDFPILEGEEDIVELIYEKKENKKDPPLNKPKRGGSKKFYVYVRDPKTKNIKKVSFGDTSGLSVKINDPKARRAFAKRHDCANKKDKTKASYWSCALPRYAKLLGLKSNFSGYW